MKLSSAAYPCSYPSAVPKETNCVTQKLKSLILSVFFSSEVKQKPGVLVNMSLILRHTESRSAPEHFGGSFAPTVLNEGVAKRSMYELRRCTSYFLL